jgi:hypothetical protein
MRLWFFNKGAGIVYILAIPVSNRKEKRTQYIKQENGFVA